MKMKHTNGGRQIEVSPDQAPMYESQGWRKVTSPPAKKTATKKTAAKPPASS